MRRLNTAAATVLLLCLGASPVIAAETRVQEVHLYAGLGSAIGLLGVTYTHRLTGSTLLEGGVGLGLSGLQLSLMPKLVFGRDRDRFVMGTGLAVALPVDGGGRAGTAVWWNTDVVGYQHIFDNGLSIAAALGLTMQIAGGYCPPYEASGRRDEICQAADLNEYRGLPLPQARLGMGYLF